MANEHAVPEEAQEKTHGDKLDKVLGEGTGLTQDTAAKERHPVAEQDTASGKGAATSKAMPTDGRGSP